MKKLRLRQMTQEISTLLKNGWVVRCWQCGGEPEAWPIQEHGTGENHLFSMKFGCPNCAIYTEGNGADVSHAKMFALNQWNIMNHHEEHFVESSPCQMSLGLEDGQTSPSDKNENEEDVGFFDDDVLGVCCDSCTDKRIAEDVSILSEQVADLGASLVDLRKANEDSVSLLAQISGILEGLKKDVSRLDRNIRDCSESIATLCVQSNESEQDDDDECIFGSKKNRFSDDEKRRNKARRIRWRFHR